MIKLALYYSPWCPFCIRVVNALKPMELEVEIRDINNEKFLRELIRGGGKQQVPCLKIESDSNDQWLYESDDIIQYLRKLSNKNK